MSVVTIFSASFCGEEEVAKGVAGELGYRLIGREVINGAAERFGVQPEKLMRAMLGAPSVFNSFTREKEKLMSYVKSALAELLKADDAVYHGPATPLVPLGISHVLRVCLTASRESRIAKALEAGAFQSKKEAARAVAKSDMELAKWTGELHKLGPWDKRLYDLKTPMHQNTVEQAVSLICEKARMDTVKTTPASRQAMEDFALASLIGVELAKEGHFDVDVVCEAGEATVLINKHVIRLEPLERELKSIAARVPGTKSVKTKVGPNFYKADIYRRQTFELPAKVLLVDDETEFVQTLSERLQMRDFGTAVAYNGEEALAMAREDEPEVMVLDLRMPGIDGIEVLKRLKKEHPEVEVIILTGHGTEKDRELAMRLGAFAYLEKPVDIEKLAETMKAANAKARENRKD